jgi:hypothetical protein
MFSNQWAMNILPVFIEFFPADPLLPLHNHYDLYHHFCPQLRYRRVRTIFKTLSQKQAAFIRIRPDQNQCIVEFSGFKEQIRIVHNSFAVGNRLEVTHAFGIALNFFRTESPRGLDVIGALLAQISFSLSFSLKFPSFPEKPSPTILRGTGGATKGLIHPCKVHPQPIFQWAALLFKTPLLVHSKTFV